MQDPSPKEVGSLFRPSLIQKLLGLFALVFLVFFLIIGMLTGTILKDQVIGNMKNSIAALVKDEGQDIEEHFRRLQQLGQKLAQIVSQWISSPPAADALRDFENKYRRIDGALRTDLGQFGSEDISAVFLSNRTALNEDIKHIITATEGRFDDYARGAKALVFNMYLITKQQMIRIYEKDWALEIEADHDFNQDVFYAIATPEQNPERQPRWTVPYYDSIWKHWMTSLITPVYVKDEFIGIVGHDVILDAIYGEVLYKRFFKTGYGFIFDADENIIVHPHHLDRLMRTAQMGTRLSFSDIGIDAFTKAISRIVKDDTTNGPVLSTEFENNLQTNHLFAYKLDRQDWYFGIVVPQSEVVERLGAFGREYVGGAILFSLLLFAVIVLISWYYVLAPIRSLTAATKDFHRQDFSRRVKTRSQDEIGDLAAAFNKMADKLQTTLDDMKRDIVERKKAEKALTASHETFLTVLDGIDATIYVADMDSYEVLFMNKYMKDSFGADLVGSTCWEVFRGERGPCGHCNNKKLLDADGNPTGVFVWEDQNPITGRWYINYDRAIKWIDGRLVRLQIATDITQLKQLENERIQAQSQLQRAQKIEAIGTLAGGIAHDFNNLLMGMMGNISMILHEDAPSEAIVDKLTKIERQVQSGSKLTSQLLGYARKGRYEVKLVDINTVVVESIEPFGRTKKQLSIDLDLADDLKTVEADKGQMEQVLLNLLINAADAMPRGGKLSVHTENVMHTEIKEKSYTPSPGEYIALTVSDNGMGMDAHTLERIFDPFFTTKKMGRGTGLGLASVYGIVKAHRGYIDVVSEKGRGTTFSIYLPASGRLPQPSFEESQPVESGSGTVLLVDDENTVLDVTSQMIAAFGYEVLKANTGDGALDLYRQHQDQILLVMLDMIMPEMGGSEVFDRIRAINPSAKVLLSSGYSMDDQAEEIVARGCDGFIQKPFNMKQLSKKIKEILE